MRTCPAKIEIGADQTIVAMFVVHPTAEKECEFAPLTEFGVASREDQQAFSWFATAKDVPDINVVVPEAIEVVQLAQPFGSDNAAKHHHMWLATCRPISA